MTKTKSRFHLSMKSSQTSATGCGKVSNFDKECDVWLASKGTLSLDNQEYGAWL